VWSVSMPAGSRQGRQSMSPYASSPDLVRGSVKGDGYGLRFVNGDHELLHVSKSGIEVRLVKCFRQREHQLSGEAFSVGSIAQIGPGTA